MAVTIKDVAKMAGTSTATVSKVLNGSYSISEETTIRIKKVMEELNYQPNQRARNLAKQSTKMIFFVTKLENNTGFNNPHMFEIICGIENTISKKNYSLCVKSVESETACEFIKDCYETGSADGFIIHPSVLSEELDNLMYHMSIPHVLLGNPNFTSHLCWIDIDNKLAGELAARHLLEKGYQRLAFIGGKAEDQISRHRLDGVMTVLKEHDIIVPNEYAQSGESECDSAYDTVNKIIKKSHIPDAIICANNYIAYGCVMALRENGVRIPEDMAVITFDDFPFSKILKPALTVVNIDVYDMGVQAGKYIIQKIKKNNLYMQSYITLPTIIERKSV